MKALLNVHDISRIIDYRFMYVDNPVYVVHASCVNDIHILVSCAVTNLFMLFYVHLIM